MKTTMKTMSILSIVIVCGMVVAAFAPSISTSVGDGPEAIEFRYDQKRTGNSGLESDITSPGIRWTFDSGSVTGTPPVAGDINNDGKTEVVWGSSDGVIYALDEDGGVL
jgi:hypothetical protein